ncbi:MAG: hypothetical protein U1D33_00865, partial [bacterium]|nr:hypothetical protein [bacterium]
MGVKDGVGASGLAKDIAAASRQRVETELILDGDADHPGDLRLVCGDAAPWRSLPDLSRLSFDSDPAWTRAFLKTASGFSGLEIAAAGENAWSQVEPHLHRFDLVVCDLGSRFHSLAASFLKQSSLFVLAAGSSITHVEALKRKSQKLSMSFFPFQRIGWVARNWGKEAFLKTADLEQITKIACVGQKGSDCLLTMDRLPPLNGDLAPFLPDRLFGEKLPPVVVKAAEEPEAPQTVSYRPELLSAVKKSMETKGLKADQNEEGLREKVRIIIHEVLQDASLDIPSETDRDVLTRELLDELLGLGPLEKLLSHPHYSEILVNGLAPIFVEEKGRLQPTSFQFINLESLNKAIERILAPLGRRV